jgi:hypothetical protein
MVKKQLAWAKRKLAGVLRSPLPLDLLVEKAAGRAEMGSEAWVAAVNTFRLGPVDPVLPDWEEERQRHEENK